MIHRHFIVLTSYFMLILGSTFTYIWVFLWSGKILRTGTVLTTLRGQMSAPNHHYDLGKRISQNFFWFILYFSFCPWEGLLWDLEFRQEWHNIYWQLQMDTWSSMTGESTSEALKSAHHIHTLCLEFLRCTVDHMIR